MPHPTPLTSTFGREVRTPLVFTFKGAAGTATSDLNRPMIVVERHSAFEEGRVLSLAELLPRSTSAELRSEVPIPV